MNDGLTEIAESEDRGGLSLPSSAGSRPCGSDKRDEWIESFPALECPCCGDAIDIRPWLREVAK